MFPSTRHSVIDRIRTDDLDARREAFGDLAAGYWKPVYKHLRLTWGLTPDDAQDVTQGFFAEAFQKAWLERFDPAKGRFRTFVRVCADRFLLNARQADARVKRGGGLRPLSLDFASAEREVGTEPAASSPDPERAFEQEFVRALFERAVAAVRLEYEARGREAQFALFERYDLLHEEGLSYARLAEEARLSVTQVTNQLAHVRRRFRERALDDLRALCGTDAEFRREARDLFGLDVP